MSKVLTEARKREQKELERVQAKLEAVIRFEPSRSVIVTTMLQRAYDLLWEGNCQGCDAITDFLPKRMVRRMLDTWCEDQFEDDPAKRSSWYHGQL